MAEQPAENTGQFYVLMNMSDDEERASKAVLMERQVKRQLMSAFDSAEQQVLTAENDISRAYSAVKRMTAGKELDINAILGHKMKITELRSAQEFIKQEYEYLFGTELPTL
jgi:hypothetical protein